MNYASIKDTTSLVLVSRLILLNQFNVLVMITFKNAQLCFRERKEMLETKVVWDTQAKR